MGKIIWKDQDLVPPLFFEAMRSDTHTVAGDISVSELIAPPQIRILRQNNDIIESATKRVFTLIGTALHSLLEKGAFLHHQEIKSLMDAGEVLDSLYNKYKHLPSAQKFADLSQEVKKICRWMIERIGCDMDALTKRYKVETTMAWKFDDIVLYGTSDFMDMQEESIEDYKLTKSWAFLHAESKDEWPQQLNVYRWLAWKNGILEPKKLNTWAFFRDFNQGQANFNPSYPQAPVLKIGQPVWDMELIEEFILKRLDLHRLASQGYVKDCTGKERWANADEHKIKLPNGNRAIFKSDNKQDAETKLTEIQLTKNPSAYIETIWGTSRRCEEWCSVAHVCPQWAEIIRQRQIENK